MSWMTASPISWPFTIHKEDIAVLAACFPEFSLIMDGTPLFAEAECVVIRLVHKKTFEIVELIIHLALALNGSAIGAHVFDTLNKYGLDAKNWRATMMDHAATNKKAMSLVEEQTGFNPISDIGILHLSWLLRMRQETYCN